MTTLLEVKTKIYKYILDKHDSITIKQFILDTSWISEDPALIDAMVRKALDDLVVLGILSQISYKKDLKSKETINQDVWILNYPLNTKDQTLQIAGDLAAAIAIVTDDLAKIAKNPYRANPLDINSHDLRFILEAADLFCQNHKAAQKELE